MWEKKRIADENKNKADLKRRIYVLDLIATSQKLYYKEPKSNASFLFRVTCPTVDGWNKCVQNYFKMHSAQSRVIPYVWISS